MTYQPLYYLLYTTYLPYKRNIFMLSKFFNAILLVFILTATLAETYFGTHWKTNGDIFVASNVYIVCGLLLAFLPLIKVRIDTPSVPVFLTHLFRWLHLPLWIYIAFWFASIVQPFFTEIPIDYHNADMIPILKIQAQRFLKFGDVYAVIPEIWGGMKPIYLTFMWLPFSLSEYWGFDARWVVLLLEAIGLFFLAKMHQKSRLLLPAILGLVGIYCVLDYKLHFDKATIVFTEEGIVVGYYLFLGYALSRKNAWLIGLGIAFCALSRYVLIFWLPIFWLYWFFYQSRREAWIILGVSTTLIFTTFLIPYGFKRLDFFLGQHNGYIEMATRTWQQEPDFVKKTLGLAKYFKIEEIAKLHQLLVATAVVVPILFAGLCFFMRKKSWFQHEMFALCSLKLSMVCFYNLLEMPYFYLFYTNTFFSYCILFHFLTLIDVKTFSIFRNKTTQSTFQ